MRSEAIDWADFLGRPPITPDPGLAESAVGGKSVLITGAAGSIGSGLAQAILAGRPRTLVLLDLSEGGIYETLRRMPAALHPEVVAIVGSVNDLPLMEDVFRRYRPDIVVHAAAYKHVSLMERNPFTAIANNAIGTYNLVTVASRHAVDRLVMISTDKAVQPASIMGASKRIAELVVLAHATAHASMNVVRLGNVLGSSGSVVPLFIEQARRGRPLTVTESGATRFFLTPDEVNRAILQSAVIPLSGKVLIPDCGEARPIIDLARYVSTRMTGIAPDKTPMEVIGLRPGDKLHEDLMSSGEQAEASADAVTIVRGTARDKIDLADSMRLLAAAVNSFDLSGLLREVTCLVPDYRPSSVLLNPEAR